MAFWFSLAIIVFSSQARAQARVDLDDLKVKGELLNERQLRMSTRTPSNIQDRVKYRRNFRSEIIDGADVRVPTAEAIDQGTDRSHEDGGSK